MRNDGGRGIPGIIVVGPCESRRVQSFAETARRLGSPSVTIVSYSDARQGRCEPPLDGWLARFESPGGCSATTRDLLTAGIRPLQQEGGQPITASEIDRLSCGRGEILHPKQWYMGLRETLHTIASHWSGARVRWMSSPKSIVTAFDKAACLEHWSRLGLPIPRQLGAFCSYEELRREVRDRHARLFLKLRYGYSAMGAVALEWRDQQTRAVTTVECEGESDRPRLFVSKRPRRLLRENEIARLIDRLAAEEILVEAWLPKARWNGIPYDLRVVMINGRMRHVVGRANASPFTNLNLDARRISENLVREQIGDAWKSLEALCEQACSACPGAGMLGLDVLVRPDRRRFALLESNAFGDYLPGLLHEGETTYEAELRPTAWPARRSTRPGPSPSGSPDILLVTFDALRFDVAETAWKEGRTPFLRRRIPQGWEPRHSAGSFTYAAHAALFAGFWPTPTSPGPHARPFALHFPGSRSVGEATVCLNGSDIVTGLADRGYYTVCIGGVGFFNPATPLGSVFPSLFRESHWQPGFGAASPNSTRDQVRQAIQCVQNAPIAEPLFLFVNVSATHPPTRGYLANAMQESATTQAAALEYVDRHLPLLFSALNDRQRRGTAYLMSDHGTLFGEEGWTGHRVGHPAVWTVPYAEIQWEASS